MFLRALLLALVCNVAHANIHIANVRTFCVNQFIPHLQAEIVINDRDLGLPGILYVGVLDDGRKHPYFLGSDGWQAWGSGTIPAYAVLRQGLSNTTITLNLSSLPPLPALNIYMGYGALTPASEKIVQAGINAVAMMRNKFPERPLPATVAPDMHRLALIQDDMTRNAKYGLVLSSRTFPICDDH